MEKRSSGQKVAQGVLDLGPAPEGWGPGTAPAPLPPGGGGDLKVCTAVDFQKSARGAEKNAAPAPIDEDPRLDELRRMGLQRVWINVAAEIGVDAFLAAWRVLDADPATQHTDTSLRVSMRVYRSYLRYQRNRYIEALAAQGVSPPEIRKRLDRQLREQVSLRHISRIAGAAKL